MIQTTWKKKYEPVKYEVDQAIRENNLSVIGLKGQSRLSHSLAILVKAA